MFSMSKSVRHGVAAIVTALSIATVAPAFAEDASASAEQTYKEIETMLGGVPTFVKLYPKAGVTGAWTLARDMLFEDTALDLKTKALISLAVAAQIPCQYCIWSDTRDALAAGATEEQVHEAVAIAGLTRHWSTVFNGLQIDFDTYKKELGGE
jgi:AhpD family alkylhydroperoxidase